MTQSKRIDPRSWIRIIVTLFVLGLRLVWWGWAGEPEIRSRLIFPDLTQADGVRVGYALTAPNNQFHQVTLTAYDTAGNLIAGEGIENPVQMNLFNFAQVAQIAAEIFKLPPEMEFNGWIDVTSTAADLMLRPISVSRVVEDAGYRLPPLSLTSTRKTRSQLVRYFRIARLVQQQQDLSVDRLPGR